MRRPGTAVFFRTVFVTVAFALAALLPQTALAGWTWDEMAAVVSTDSSSPGDTTPAGDTPDARGWTWDERGGDPAATTTPAEDAEPSDAPPDEAENPDGWTWDEGASPTTRDGAAPAPADPAAPADEPAPRPAP